ncbi:hypothetical protein Q3G72_022241 [Acer saccharum]|nr:hypothetical protein Q3G72_022241 [Acer saccharum]
METPLDDDSSITITDYSKTQRIVLLIDLNPLLHLRDPKPYLKALSAAAKTLISFPPLASSLFSIKPFFSSLSPLLSSSKLPSPSFSLSFDRPDTTLRSLESLISNPSLKTLFLSPSSSRGVNVAASMRQLVHDYTWDPVICDCEAGATGGDYDPGNVSAFLRSNLVVLFSPIVKSFDFMCGFLDVDVDDECLRDEGLFNNRFRGLFETVNDAFIRNDIHFSWVDVKCEFESSDGNQTEVKSGFFESGIRGLGWGFCSSDSIVLGSVLVNFGLIYPRIGISSRLFDCNSENSKTNHAQLNLEILDVSGKPLECKCCDLELINLDIFERDRFLGHFVDGTIKLQVKSVYKREEGLKFEGQLPNPILVRECSKESVKDEKENFGEFFADKVLEVLAKDMGEFRRRKVAPTWQIFLSFLYREGYWALVSFSNGNGDSCIGILKPFTVFSALLCIVDDESFAHSVLHELGGVDLSPFVMKRDKEICKSDMIATHDREVKSKKNKRCLRLFQDLTWNDFCKVALEQAVIDMEDVYFARRCNSSKKLKFLKCWMKQIKKSRSCSLTVADKSETNKEVTKEIENRVADLTQESERPIPSSVSLGEESLTGASRIQDDAAFDMCSGTSESFFGDLNKKIQQGLESEGVDLGTLAERLVNSSIYWLYQKHESGSNSQCETSAKKPDDACGTIVAVELTKLLLREPKELINMHKSNDPSTQASDPRPTEIASENIVREYELQILFRMEILQSQVGASVEEPMKQKFVKQICFLLEAIQCHLQGGFFGDWSLDNYVGKIIKSRYCDTLSNVVDRIYTKMDLLLFADEDESPNHLLNSEDSNQSWRDRQHGDVMGEHSCINEPNSARGEQENDNESPQGSKREEHARKVMEACQRRERARRFSSFMRVPDLQRVWAPKQSKAMKSNSWKMSNRKDHKRGSYDKVCETPMSRNKRSCPQGSSTDDESHQSYGNHLCGSVSKALFQDDW